MAPSGLACARQVPLPGVFLGLRTGAESPVQQVLASSRRGSIVPPVLHGQMCKVCANVSVRVLTPEPASRVQVFFALVSAAPFPQPLTVVSPPCSPPGSEIWLL